MIRNTRQDVVVNLMPLVFFLVLFVVAPAAGMFSIRQQSADAWFVFCLLVGVCGPFAFMFFLAPKMVPKWAIRSRLRKEIEKIESSILNHAKDSEVERIKCETRFREVEAELGSLPDKQASHLSELQKTLAEMKKALAGL